MTKKEIEERFQRNVSILKALEQILKEMPEKYEVHNTRINWLQHLLDSVSQLRSLESESLDKTSNNEQQKLTDLGS